ncbi:transposase [Vairimorpha necatrix]|uniref:Transposase n=1 Tax=Vairimorpha necatrix TaxID=6039 RepID=A0AAX4JG55_9MICR
MINKPYKIAYEHDLLIGEASLIGNFLKDPAIYGVKRSTERPKKLSLRTRARVIKLARGKNKTANSIKGQLDLKVHKCTILRVLKNEGKGTRRKIKRKPSLTKTHKKNRIRFYLGGLYGYSYYGAGFHTKEVVYSRRAMGGTSVMIWGCFNFSGKSRLAIIEENIDSNKYQNILDDYLIPFIIQQNLMDPIFQQDNARPHVSKSTKNWFVNNNIERMFWPALSPDLNSIENLRGELSSMVYGDGKTYDDIDSLKKSINENWHIISQRYCQKLVDSMEKRLTIVLNNDGGSTKY